VNEGDVASFRDRGFEVCLENDALGEIRLVPAYTGQVRQELTIQHAALLAAVGAVFPEAKVTALRRPESQGAPKKK
jgi:hypothetical protein